MHIPDGWLSLEIILLTGIVSLLSIAFSLYKLRDIDESEVTKLGVVSAIIIGAQMFNFPLFIGPFTGHLLGGTLATILLGPWQAMLSIASVLIVQAVVFADGGILALTANIMNMGVIPVIITVAIKGIILRVKDDELGVFGITTLSGFVTVPIAAAFALIELFISGQFGSLNTFLSTSLFLGIFYHVLIGIGEAILSLFIVLYLWKVDFPIGLLNSIKPQRSSANVEV